MRDALGHLRTNGVVLGYTSYVALNQTATICRPTVGPNIF